MCIHSDKDFWTTLEWPAAPDENDFQVFKKYCSGSVLLLGSTHLLLPSPLTNPVPQFNVISKTLNAFVGIPTVVPLVVLNVTVVI